METIDSLNFQENASSQELTINTAIKSYLQQSAKWGKFLSIIGFVFIGLMTILAFSMGALLSTLGQAGGPFAAMGAMGAMGGGVITFIYLLFALFYFFPTLYLFKFSSKTLKALKNNTQIDMTEAFSNLKSMFKFWGIFMIVILSFYGIALLIGLIGILAR